MGTMRRLLAWGTAADGQLGGGRLARTLATPTELTIAGVDTPERVAVGDTYSIVVRTPQSRPGLCSRAANPNERSATVTHRSLLVRVGCRADVGDPTGTLSTATSAARTSTRCGEICEAAN